MNKLIKTTILSIACLLTDTTNSFAFDTEIGGIYYNVNQSKKTAEVTYFANDDTNMSKYQGDIVIPSTIEYSNEIYNVVKIGGYAFKGCIRLNSVTISEGVTQIGNSFYGCKGLKSVTIPSSVVDIQSFAFWECTSLQEISLPSGMTEIKDGLFEYCSSLASIELPSSISKIGSQAFYGCTSLTEFQFPEGITEISQAVLWGCSNLSKVTMPSSVSTIGIGAFYGCKSLVEIEISDQIVNIPDNTFNGCSSLTSIVIPENVMQIGKDAFSFCSGLKTIISKATIPPYCQSSTFYGVDKANCQLFVPEGSVDAYKNDNYWKEFYNCSNIATISTDDKLELVYSLGGYITNSANKGISIINNGGTHRVILVR